MATITIKNTNEVEKFELDNWNTGLASAKGEEATVKADFPKVENKGAVKFRFWETEQYCTVEAGKSETITTDSEAETKYYEGLNGIAGLEVTSA